MTIYAFKITVSILILIGVPVLFWWIHNHVEPNSPGPTNPVPTLDPNLNIEEYFSWLNDTKTLAAGSIFASMPPQCWNHFGAILNLEENTYQEDDIGPPEGKHYLHLPCQDGEPDSFRARINEGVEYITHHQENGTPTLVHCAAGQSRSISMVLAYYPSRNNPGSADELAQLFQMIKRRRPQARPHYKFVEALSNLYGIETPDLKN